MLEELQYWIELEKKMIKPLPKEKLIAKKLNKDHHHVEMELTEKQTEQLLKQVNITYNTEINDILLTALGLAVKEWTGEDKVLINLEGHGREEIVKDIDISRTVGWFTAQYPVILDVSGEGDISYRIKSTKENLRGIPNKGIGYGILQYLTLPENKGNIGFNLKPEMSFNYLGQFDGDVETGVFETSDISTGTAVSPNMESLYSIDIVGIVNGRKLMINFSYNKVEYREETITKLAEEFKKNLARIIKHCISMDHTEMTPSDFTESELSFEDIEDVFSDFESRIS
jgi:non-ribosomal peptide synthase protein (TIGR01720 family)